MRTRLLPWPMAIQGQVGKSGLSSCTRLLVCPQTLPNLYNSFVDNVPLLVIVGDVNSRSLIRQPGLALDELENLAKPVTRWCYYAKSTSDVATAIKRSVSILYSTQPGPCCVIVPEDLFEQDHVGALHKPVSPPTRTTISPDLTLLTEVTTLIDQAEWPVVIVGREVKNEKSIQSLVDFCERLSVPVLLESPYPSAYGIGFPQDNICYLGLFRRESEVMKGADLVVGVGGQAAHREKILRRRWSQSQGQSCPHSYESLGTGKEHQNRHLNHGDSR